MFKPSPLIALFLCLQPLSVGAQDLAPLGAISSDHEARVTYFARCTGLAIETRKSADSFQKFPEADDVGFRYNRDRGIFDMRLLEAALSAQGHDWTEVVGSEDKQDLLVTVMRDVGKMSGEYAKSYVSAATSEQPEGTALVKNDLIKCAMVEKP